LWEQIVAGNPVEGRFSSRLADAYYHQQRYEQAIAAYQRALKLGVAAYQQATDHGYGFPFDVAFRIACCHALQGTREHALSWLQTAFDLGYRDLEGARTERALESLHDSAQFREIVGLVDTAGLARDDGWRADLALLAREIQRRGRNLPRPVSVSAVDVAASALHDAIPRLSDTQIAVELMKLMRLVGDAHSGLQPPEDHPELSQALPVLFYRFEEGVFVIAADPRYAHLLGQQVLRFGDRALDEVWEALDPLVGRDNSQWLKLVVPYRMRELPLLHALGLLPDPRQVTLTVRDQAGRTTTAALAADASQPMRKLAGVVLSPPEWHFYPDTLPAPLPLYLKNREAGYWFEYLPQDRVAYFQFNRVRDDAAEPLADFSARLFAFIAAHDVEKLVIDLRWNQGGNTFLEMPLLHRLIGSPINRRGQLFVIIGRRTYSAAQNGATMIERHTEAIFAGEPTGSSPNFIGETARFELPYSKLLANVSDLYWQTSWPTDYRTWIAPLLYTPPTFAAFRENRDPALDAILACREHLPGT
jgi:tetratricopeptide (TPR) repeat protein